jgi:hypothetical protein
MDMRRIAERRARRLEGRSAFKVQWRDELALCWRDVQRLFEARPAAESAAPGLVPAGAAWRLMELLPGGGRRPVLR